MKTIDFLPERYRQATKQRRTSYWRLVVTGFFILAFAGAAGGLFLVERDVRRRYNDMNALHAAAQSQQMLVANKQAELSEMRKRAELATFLRHPWPRSRIVHEAMTSLPAEVTIERVRIHTTERPKTRVVEAAVPVVEGATPKAESAETDLEKLRAAIEAVDLLVTLEGITQDQPALHVYLQSLAGSKLFVKAELTSIEALTGDNNAGEARFAVRIVVRPGWGMPGGPSAEESEPSEAADSQSETAMSRDSSSRVSSQSEFAEARIRANAAGRSIP